MSWFGGGPFEDYFTPERTLMLLRAVVTLAVGLLVARLTSAWFGRLLENEGRAQQALIAKRVTFYAMFTLVLVMSLHELGFHLSVLFGAAGILTVAVGFASQTSASNLISGLFLIAERSFVVGDTIQIGEHTGEIQSIDLLSVKLRTFDNTLVRVPNEEIIKSRVRNLTHFPIRRSDVSVTVAYATDLERVRRLFHEVSARIPQCLAEPPPQFFVSRFAESGVVIQLSAWTRREGFAEFQNRVREEILTALREEGVEVPYPQVVVHQVADAPTPVREAD